MKNDWFKLLLTGIAIFIMRTTVLANAPVADGYNIKVRITEFDKDTIFLGYHLGNQTFIRDTAILDKKTGFFTFKDDKKKLEAGVYLIVTPPENSYFQIMVPADEQQFSMTTSTLDFYGKSKFTGSKDNDLFYDYMKFLSKKRGEAEAAGELRKKDSLAGSKKLELLDKEVKGYQADLIAKNPKSITAMLIKTAVEIETPLFPEIKDKEKNEYARYVYFKQHCFDNFEMSNPALLRTPVLAQRIDYYLEKLTPQHPDSISESLDHVLDLLQPNKEAFQYYFVQYLNKYIKSNVVGYDAIHVHLTRKYIETGLTDSFIPKENKLKLIDQATKLFPILIGKQAPDIKTFKEDNSTISVSDIKAKYTVLFFFAPDCGHCQKQSPFLVEFLKGAKEKKIDVKVLAVCTYPGPDKMPECWKYAKEKGFGDFINTVDPYMISRYKTLYNVETTPQVYVLDEEKKIRSKSIEAKQLTEVLDHIIEEDNAKLKLRVAEEENAKLKIKN
jgi:thiol-disulfide isomerase/thioredoxin